MFGMFGFAEANRSQSAIGEPLGDSISQTEKSLTQHESAESAEKTAVNGILKKKQAKKTMYTWNICISFISMATSGT